MTATFADEAASYQIAAQDLALIIGTWDVLTIVQVAEWSNWGDAIVMRFRRGAGGKYLELESGMTSSVNLNRIVAGIMQVCFDRGISNWTSSQRPRRSRSFWLCRLIMGTRKKCSTLFLRRKGY
jgi:hypothetical protein